MKDWIYDILTLLVIVGIIAVLYLIGVAFVP